ncbi:MAG: hypothetical protein K0Q73_8830 [Paenibacillus sp.]|jgi:hypothetical protein|nr:hypothetical protein [Paenibacillus sp.]
MNSEARALLRATYLKPLRDAEHEMAPRKNSRLSQILDSHQAFEDKETHHLKRVMEQANEMILHYFQGHDGKQTFDDQSGKLLLEKINTYLKEFSPSTLRCIEVTGMLAVQADPDVFSRWMNRSAFAEQGGTAPRTISVWRRVRRLAVRA